MSRSDSFVGTTFVHAGGVWPWSAPWGGQGCIPTAWSAKRTDRNKSEINLHANPLVHTLSLDTVVSLVNTTLAVQILVGTNITLHFTLASCVVVFGASPMIMVWNNTSITYPCCVCCRCGGCWCCCRWGCCGCYNGPKLSGLEPAPPPSRLTVIRDTAIMNRWRCIRGFQNLRTLGCIPHASHTSSSCRSRPKSAALSA